LRRFLRGCDVAPLPAEESHDVGSLLGNAGTSDVVDAHVVHVAQKIGASVLTGDVEDLSQLADHADRDVAIIPL
jgi:hypothetical protein